MISSERIRYCVMHIATTALFLVQSSQLGAMHQDDDLSVPLMSDIQEINYDNQPYTLAEDAALFEYARLALEFQNTNKTLDDLLNNPEKDPTLLGHRFGNVTPELLSQARHYIKTSPYNLPKINPSVIALLHMLMPHNTERMQEIHTVYSEEKSSTKLYRLLNSLRKPNDIQEHETVNCTLDLSNSFLGTLYGFKPDKWGNVLRIDLSHNYLLHSYLATLTKCKNVKCINLSNNKISSISKQELDSIPHTLEKLDLRNNIIKVFPLDTALYKKQGLILDISGNPIARGDSLREKIFDMAKVPLSYKQFHTVRRFLFVAALACSGMGATALMIELIRDSDERQMYFDINVFNSYIYHFVNSLDLTWPMMNDSFNRATDQLLQKKIWSPLLKTKVQQSLKKYACTFYPTCLKHSLARVVYVLAQKTVAKGL